jgi:tRNA(fMet)-specific endonuclease VapC
MRYLLDTNICVYAIKGQPDSVIGRLRSLKAGDVAISVVTAYELWFGVHKSERVGKNREALETFLTSMTVLAFEDPDAQECGKLRAQLERKGTPIGPYDLQIAAQARRHGLVLVTHNEAEFKRIPGLTVENWTAPPARR